MNRVIIILMVLVLGSGALAQDYTVVFEGRPLRKVESSFERTTESTLGADDAFKYSVRIVQRGGKYYWASRGIFAIGCQTRNAARKSETWSTY